MKEKILITGASGFIGSHLVDYLISLRIPQHSIRVLLRGTSSQTYIQNYKKLDIVIGDLRNKRTLIEATKDVSTVYHLASLVRFKAKKDEDFILTNVVGTKNLLEACKINTIKKFVFFSSVAAYGLPAFVGDITNWNEMHPCTYSEIYGKTKYQAELLVRQAHKQWGLPITIIRPVSVYGPRDTGQLFGLFKAIKKRQFFMIGNGRNKLHFIYVTDLVKAAGKAEVHTKKSSEYIIGEYQPVTLKEIVKEISRSIHVSLRTVTMAKNIALAMSYPLEFIGEITGFPSPLFPERVKTITSTYYYDTSKMQHELGFKPSTTFKDGIRITARWYKQNGYI